MFQFRHAQEHFLAKIPLCGVGWNNEHPDSCSFIAGAGGRYIFSVSGYYGFSTCIFLNCGMYGNECLRYLTPNY